MAQKRYKGPKWIICQPTAEKQHDLLKQIASKLDGLRAEPMDMAALAEVLRNSMPAPVQPVDANAIARAIVQAMPKTERPKSVTIVKDKNGKFTATPKFD